VLALAEAYPGDIGILAPIILNLIHMKPGQAIYLPAGQLHAYLKGVGIELMANSDNVLRGGLTPKHIDREELMHVLHFAPAPPEMVVAQPVSATETTFPTPAEEFALAQIHVTHDAPHASPRQRNVEILFVAEGDVLVASDNGEPPLPLTRGDSVLIPAAAGAYRLAGKAEIYRATVPPP
jgi:mannose-6-phosphate isomerase